MKKPFLLLFATGSLLSAHLFAQAPPGGPPQPPPVLPPQPQPGLPPQPGAPLQPGGPQPPLPPLPGNNGQRPNRPFVEQMKRHFQGQAPLKEMSQEERQRLRKAMEAVWTAPEVKSARDEAWEATKKYRDALRAAVLLADPEIRPLLERLLVNNDPLKPPFAGQTQNPQLPGEQNQPRGPRPQGQGPQGGVPQRPTPGEVPNDPNARGEGQPKLPLLEPREAQRLTEEQRSHLRELHDQIAQRKDVQDARRALNEAPIDGKREAFQRLRRVAFAALKEAAPELAKALETLRAEAGGASGEGQLRGKGRSGLDQPIRPNVQGKQPEPNSPGDPNAPGAPENAPPPPPPAGDRPEKL